MATLLSTQSYRTRIYRNYASEFQNSGAEFDFDESVRWGRAYDYYLRRWLPTDRQAAIVDLACGRGRLLHFFQRRGYVNVQGVDVSPEQVQLARQVVPQVLQGDVLSFLEEHPGQFRLITGFDIVEHFTKDEVLRFLDLCYRALGLGGRLILQTPNADTPWGSYHRYNDLTHEFCFQHNSLTNLMRTCGFSTIEHREQGPVPWGYSLTSSLRFAVWQFIRLALRVYNLAETGTAGSGTFTRVFLISGIRR